MMSRIFLDQNGLAEEDKLTEPRRMAKMNPSVVLLLVSAPHRPGAYAVRTIWPLTKIPK